MFIRFNIHAYFLDSPWTNYAHLLAKVRFVDLELFAAGDEAAAAANLILFARWPSSSKLDDLRLFEAFRPSMSSYGRSIG